MILIGAILKIYSKLIQWNVNNFGAINCTLQALHKKRTLNEFSFLMERETGLEPATFCLGSKHSTTELLPLTRIYSSIILFKFKHPAIKKHPINIGRFLIKIHFYLDFSFK